MPTRQAVEPNEAHEVLERSFERAVRRGSGRRLQESFLAISLDRWISPRGNRRVFFCRDR